MENKDKFEIYKNLLREWSGRMNLVAPSTLSDIDNRHIADSAQLAEYLPADCDVIDLGSGAGFPGVVLAILGWRVTCIESIGKKVSFLTEVKNQLHLDNLTIYHGRVENYVAGLDLSKKYIFTARAFAPLVRILDYVYKTRCELFLLKGSHIKEEINAAKRKYNFDFKLYPSKTGDGFIINVKNHRYI